MYERCLATMRTRGSTTARERIRSIIVIEVTDAAPLVSPAYDDGTPAEEIERRSLDRYGLRRA
jgi:hypothetical protein